jgi:hypothetical protein
VQPHLLAGAVVVVVVVVAGVVAVAVVVVVVVVVVAAVAAAEVGTATGLAPFVVVVLKPVSHYQQSVKTAALFNKQSSTA